jgi:hypothetical protein
MPTDHERRVLLELLQSPQESLESIANELKIAHAALTIYLATDDAATIFAQADLANARRARTAATAQLEQCIGALSLMISGWVSDVTHNLRRETPKSRREQDREQESTRRAAILLYRIANFTPKTLTLPASAPPPAPPLPAKRGEVPESARAVRGRDPSVAPPTPENPPLPNTNPTRKRGVTQTPLTPPTHANQHLPSPPASPNPTPPPAATDAPIPAPTSDTPHPRSDINPLTTTRRETDRPSIGSSMARPAQPVHVESDAPRPKPRHTSIALTISAPCPADATTAPRAPPPR